MKILKRDRILIYLKKYTFFSNTPVTLRMDCSFLRKKKSELLSDINRDEKGAIFLVNFALSESVAVNLFNSFKQLPKYCRYM